MTLDSLQTPVVTETPLRSQPSGAGVQCSALLAGQPVTPYYEESGIVIYCADNRRVLPHLAPCDLLLTDPPFGIGFAAQPTTGQRKRGQARETWDDATPEEWTLLLARQLCAKPNIVTGKQIGRAHV